MKKKNLKSLNLNKSLVSELTVVNKIFGGEQSEASNCYALNRCLPSNHTCQTCPDHHTCGNFTTQWYSKHPCKDILDKA